MTGPVRDLSYILFIRSNIPGVRVVYERVLRSLVNALFHALFHGPVHRLMARGLRSCAVSPRCLTMHTISGRPVRRLFANLRLDSG
jgi:hypothetical protein